MADFCSSASCLILMLLYLRTRRLAPLIFAHWPMDIAAAIITYIYSP